MRRTSSTRNRNPIRVWDLGEGFTMMVGANKAAIILEIGYVHGVEAVVIVHAMRSLRRLRPDPSHELDRNAVALLRLAVQEPSDAERHVLAAIQKAREAGMSWSLIGTFVGTTGCGPPAIPVAAQTRFRSGEPLAAL